MTIPSFRTPVLLAALAVAVVPTVARAQPPDVDPEAPKILRRMTDYLGSLQQFTVDTQTTVEVVLTSGQKLQFDTMASVMVRRPDKLRSDRKGDLVSQTFYYNGKTLTIYNPRTSITLPCLRPPLSTKRCISRVSHSVSSLRQAIWSTAMLTSC